MFRIETNAKSFVLEVVLRLQQIRRDIVHKNHKKKFWRKIQFLGE